jgi:ribosomal protein S16
MSDPWAAAQSASSPASTAPAGESQLADSYGQEESQLFSGGGEGAGPSLFNKTHPVGTERTGIIVKPPYDRHSTNMKGELKYWQQGEKQPVTNAVNPATGQPNRPVMDTVIVLDTEYQMDAAEAAALGREAPYEGGQRSDTISKDMKLVMEAIADAVKRGVQITKGADMVGKRYTKKRVSQKPNPHGGDPIKEHSYRIDNA